jgi:glycosyltransferase involved in cell wall biosynthesis
MTQTASRPIVLHLVCGIDPRGGTASYVRQISGHTIAGFEQRVWRHRDYKAENDSYICRGWARKTEVNAAMDVLGAFLDFLPLWFWLRKNPAVILHAHTRMGTVLAVLIRTLKRIPIITHLHVRWRQVKLHKWLWDASRATVIFNSKGTCLHFGRRPENSEILMPCMPWPEKPLREDERYISASLIVPHKNIHLIVEAFNQTRPNQNLPLYIYGFSVASSDAGYEKHVADLARQNPRIHLETWNPHWAEKMGCSDVFIHASELESFGIVLLEAYAKGCRIIAPYGTFLEDLPLEGIFLTELTVQDLFKKMELAQTYPPSPALWEKRKSVAPLFSVENTALRLSSLYTAALNGRK